MRRLKIVSDGTPQGTKVKDAETNEILPYPITDINWHLNAKDDTATAQLTFMQVEIEAEADEKEI